MDTIENHILKVLDRSSLTNIQIAILTRIGHKKVSKALKQLRNKGMIISRGATSARRHMRLATAIEQNLTEVLNLNTRLRLLERNLNN